MLFCDICEVAQRGLDALMEIGENDDPQSLKRLHEIVLSTKESIRGALRWIWQHYLFLRIIHARGPAPSRADSPGHPAASGSHFGHGEHN